MTQNSVYVSPSQGRDSQDGSLRQPLQTIAEALRRSPSGTVIHLMAGLYSVASGEQFPLRIPAGRRILGATAGDRPVVTLEGGGSFSDPVLGIQSVTCALEDEAALENVTLINPLPQGIGLWIDRGHPTVQAVHITRCPRYGVVITQDAIPTLRQCQLLKNGEGVALFGRGKGVLDRLVCQGNTTGIALRDQASPLIRHCQVTANGTGVLVMAGASPVLRGNQVVQNRNVGLEIQGQGRPDLGQPQDMGNNVVRQNGQMDVRNRSGRSLSACGNDLVPQGLEGAIALVASDLPDPAAVPVPLLSQPPVATPPPSTEAATPAPGSERQIPLGSTQFLDMPNHWAGAFVDGLAAQGLVKGFVDGTFRPNEAVTRAQFAALMVASFPDRPQGQAASTFTDIPPGFWAAAVLSQAQRMGFLTGFPDGTMRPEQPMTRIQAIVAIANGLGLSGGRGDAIGIYRDRAQIPSYAVDALANATQHRLVVNYPEALELRPMEAISRGEVVALVYQGRVALGLAPAVTSPYIVRPDTTQTSFSDLTGHWAAEFIQGLAAASLVSGMVDGRFMPDGPMTRAQYAAVLVNAFQPPPQRAGLTFRDVPSNFWGAEAIQTAYRGGFLSGFPDQTFAPNNNLLRVQVWVSLVEGLGLGSNQEDFNRLGRFEDYTQIPRYALAAVAAAQRRSLIVSYPDPHQLRPNQVATRAEVCAIVYQAMVTLGRLPAIASAYIFSLR